LRVARFRNQVWYFVVAIAVAFFIFLLVFLKPLIVKVGFMAAIWWWIAFVVVWVSVFTYGLWKYRLVEKVETENNHPEKTTP